MHVYAAVPNNTFYKDEISGFKNLVEWTWDASSLHRLIFVVVSRLQILPFFASVVSTIADFRITVIGENNVAKEITSMIVWTFN